MPAELTLDTNPPAGTPLIVDAGTVSAPILLNVVNNQSNAPADFRTGWQTTLAIIPDAEATGSVAFNSAVEPPDYLFEPIGNFGLAVNNSGNELLAFDANFPFSGGIEVPTVPAANLLSVDFRVSTSAMGLFEIFALADPGDTEWTDASQPAQNRRTFANVADDGVPVLIGEVLVLAADVLGDFNGDQTVDSLDIDLMRHAVMNATVDPMFNVDGKGAVGIADEADFDFLVQVIIGTGRGDGDLNRVINFNDFVRISNNFKLGGANWSEGNYNVDTVTNFADFAELSNRFGIVFTSEDAQPVPEPAVLLLIAVGGFLLVRRP